MHSADHEVLSLAIHKALTYTANERYIVEWHRTAVDVSVYFRDPEAAQNYVDADAPGLPEGFKKMCAHTGRIAVVSILL